MSSQDVHFMSRALELAELGRGKVSPNPMVGCVIVHDNIIIGEGYHQQYGEAHAEVNAINAVEDQSLLEASTVYVTLEPCAHHGKTPPCADLLVSKKVKRVVVGALDSNPLVGGKGLERMQQAGIDVNHGVLADTSRALNTRFFTFIEKRRPYIILKWAQTSDGFVARENFDSKWISGEASRSLVHQWRAEEDAIMVGTRTAKHDNPRLNVRAWSGKDPLRLVIDKSLTLNKALNLFDGSQPTVIYNDLVAKKEMNLEYVKVEGQDYLPEILSDLYTRKIQSVIIEGGGSLLNSCLKAGLWDEARIFTAPVNFDAGVSAPELQGNRIDSLTIGEDQLDMYNNLEPSFLQTS